MFFSSDFTFLIFQKLRPKDRISLSYTNKSIYKTQYAFLPNNTSFYVSDGYECINVPNNRLNEIVKNPVLIIQNSQIITSEIIQVWIQCCIFYEVIIHIPSPPRFENFMSIWMKNKCFHLANRFVIDLTNCYDGLPNCYDDLPNVMDNYDFKFKRVRFHYAPYKLNSNFIPQNLFHSLHVEYCINYPYHGESITKQTIYLAPDMPLCEFKTIINRQDTSNLQTGVVIDCNSNMQLCDTFLDYLISTNKIEYVDFVIDSVYRNKCFDHKSLINKLLPKLRYLIFPSMHEVKCIHSELDLYELSNKYHHIRFKIQSACSLTCSLLDLDNRLIENINFEFKFVTIYNDCEFTQYLKNCIISECQWNTRPVQYGYLKYVSLLIVIGH